MRPNHPVYIVSKGRADRRLTADVLDRMGVPYFVVVEGSEADAYRAAVCRLAWRFGGPHHYCDYRRFKHNRLIRKPGVEIPSEPNEYEMRLVRLDDARYSQGGNL